MKETPKSVNPFGEWLRTKRKGRGWSMRVLSERAGDICSPQYIGQLEKNTYPGINGEPMQASELIVERLAVALGESINEARALAKYPRLDDEDIANLDKFQDALFNFQKLSARSQIFLKKHFRETIDFLLEFELPKEVVASKGSLMKLVDESEETGSDEE